MSEQKEEVEILRVVISSNISGSVLCDKTLNWPFVYEHFTIAKLCQVLLQIATEFDDGKVQFASFELPDQGGGQQNPRLSNQNSETRYLNLGLLLKDDIITALFYKINVDKRTDKHQKYIDMVSSKIADAFAQKHLALHKSLRETLENMVKETATMPPDAVETFQSFAHEIPALVQ